MLGEAAAEEPLAQAVEAAKPVRVIRPPELRVVSIDTTVQQENVGHPPDSRLLEVARTKLAENAAEATINLIFPTGSGHLSKLVVGPEQYPTL